MPIPTRRRPSIAAFRPCVRVLAGVIAVACGAGCEAQSPGLSGFFMRPLPIVDATRERDGTLVRVEMPSGGVPALVRVGKPPTPASVAGYGATRDTVVVAIYESLSDLQLLAINKASGDVTTLTCDGSSLTKYVRPDVASPRIAWIPTSLSPALFRFDERSSTVTKVLDVPGETHVPAFDQAPDGTIYIGTAPHRKCFRVRIEDGAPKVKEIVLTHKAVAGCAWIREVFVADDALFLYCTSPGVLLRHELKTGTQTVVLQTKANTLRVRVTETGISASDGQTTVAFDRSGRPVANVKGDSTLVYTPLRERGRIEWPGGSKTFSLLARGRGMRITCLERAFDGNLYGSTYWNTWTFRIDPGRRPKIDGLGPIRGATGEFFTFGRVGNELAIPQYQGNLFFYDPARPWSDDAAQPNPRLALATPAHYGLDAVTDAQGRLIYVTAPNFGQLGSMMVVRRPNGTHETFPRVGDDLILGRLVANEHGVFGGTSPISGIGNRSTPAPAARPIVVRLNVSTGGVAGSVTLSGSNTEEVRDMLDLGDGRLLVATTEGLHLVDVRNGGLSAQTLGAFDLLTKKAAGRLIALTRTDDGAILVLAKNLLMTFSPASGSLTTIARLPVPLSFMSSDRRGTVWLADESELFALTPETMASLRSVPPAGVGR